MNTDCKFTNKLKYVLVKTLLLALPALGATSAWGQDHPYKGIWYLKNFNTDYYVVPAGNPSKANYEDAYYSDNYSTQNGDPNKPFITTYKTGGIPNTVWLFVPVEGEPNYYNIIHAVTGRYLVYKKISTYTGDNARRKFVHLESLESSPGETEKFEITSLDSYVKIKPKNDAMYLNIAGGNKDSYNGSSGSSPFYSGIIGGMNGTDNGSKFKNVETLLDAPTITYSSGVVTAVTDNNSLPAGYNVRYTVDGSTPTANSALLPVGGYNVEDPCTFKAVIERYGIVLTGVASQDVVPSVLKPTFTPNADGSVIISSESGNTIYYTLDGTEPTTSTTTFATTSVTLSSSDLQSATVIKAIAYNPGNSKTSAIAPQTLVTYTYKIVNLSDKVAVNYAIKEAVGKPLSGYMSIPSAIRSAYLSDGTVAFRSFEGSEAVGDDVPQATLDAHNTINATPAGDANIYVTYTVDTSLKFLPLTNASPYNITSGSNYYYDNEGVLDEDGTYDEEKMVTRPYLWYFLGSDPYDVTVQNVGTSKYWHYESSQSSLNDASQTFILKEIAEIDPENPDASKKNVVLINPDGTPALTLTVNTVVLPLHFILIDRQGKVIQSDIRYQDSEGFRLPAAWQSPLVSEYQYYKKINNQVGNQYFFALEDRITRSDQVGSDNKVYVTYTVNNDLLDLDGRNSLGIARKNGKTYMLKFLTPENNDTYKFYQEDGGDGVMTTKRRAVYPYSNGDAQLYVYGTEKWAEDLGKGASTRTRWLWYIEPTNNPTSLNELDPYHVMISSYQDQTNYTNPETDEIDTRYHSYLKTYIPEGHSAVVTGVTNSNPLAHGGTAGGDDNKSDATEYMILGTSINNVRLTTFSGIEGAPSTEIYGTRQTVHSFEQYWKTYETVSGKGTYNYELPVNNPAFTDKGITLNRYQVWANARPINTLSPTTQKTKAFEKDYHYFQTIEMGEQFTFEETTLDPMLILLDKHGWEIARIKLPSGPDDPNRAARYAEIHKYSSPMVERYHFWKTGTKVAGYHKYTVSDYATISDTNPDEYTADELGRADINNPSTPANLPNYETQAFVAGRERDWYVTYDVNPLYANAYKGAETESETTASKYLLKQGEAYASYSGSGTALGTETTLPSSIGSDMQWYLRPNFNIDREMGYRYLGESGAQDDALSQLDTETANYAAGRNGFDPYNVQIQSVADTDRYLTTNTSGSTVSSAWTGTTSSLSVNELQNRQTAFGLDQTRLNITNATFMIVDDGSGNMILMPRFDHQHVVNAFTGTEFVDAGSSTQHLMLEREPTIVTNSSQITAMGGYYILAENFTCTSSVGTPEEPFTGIIDGCLRTFRFSAPLVAYAKDATIKNILLKDVQISGTVSTGAICGTAAGTTRIFNCGILPSSPTFKEETSTVSGSDYCGSIAGELKDNARVINCFSYATITGGTTVGGIVGYIGNTAITQNNVSTVPMVMNCMFYGEISGGSTRYPVYGGAMIQNDEATGKGVNPYNYFRKNATFDDSYTNINNYNRSWPAEEKNLTRFEYYRSILNSNKNLVTYWITDKEYSNQTDDDHALMAKWVLDPNIAPYPILKTWGYYPSVINLDTGYRINPDTKAKEARSGAQEWEGKSYGTLTVTINAGTNYSGSTSRNITITDMDTLNCDYGYYKIQLPYYNKVFGNPNGTTHAEKYANNYTSKVVTGWKITSVTGGTPGEFVKNWETGYNFADRNCTSKDLYGTSGRVFAQGGYYYVPVGVTAINIEAYWGEAVYLANRGHSIDRVSLTSADYKADNAFTPAGTVPTTFQGQTVYNDLQNAIKALQTNSTCPTVYDQAIVLIGNHQVKNGSNDVGYNLDSKWHPFTLMSADFDFDCEPDYCLEWQFRHQTPRKGIQPVRFDFLPIVELGLAVRHDNKAYAIGIFVPQGHFEVTETAFIRTTQFEFDGFQDYTDKRLDDKSPMIINGGEYEMFNIRYHASNRTLYFLLGGKAWVHRFAPGAHPNTGQKPAAYFCAVNAIGGEYPEFYLSGIYRPDIAAPANQGAPHCYTNGGKFGTMAGAGYDKVAGGVTFKINHSLIDEFYGGGINGSNPIGGNIDVTIDYSRVEKYCGGPKVGNMTGKTVTTNATGTTFGVFFGAGNGGNSYYRQLIKDGDTESKNIATWTGQYGWGNFSPLKTTFDDSDVNKGYHAEYEFEVFNHSNGVTDQITQRSFIHWIQFGITTTGNVTSNLTDCTVSGNFYGGGNLASVSGNVVSTLTNTTVVGNAFGGGFSASIPTFSVHDKDVKTFPSMDFAGTITDGNIGYKEDGGQVIEYEWTNDLNGKSEADRKKDPAYQKDGKWYCYTWNSLENLGAVTGNATINIEGNTLVQGNIYNDEGEVIDHAGVFGGGDASKVIGNTLVHMNASGQNSEGYNTYNIYGGGNTADVEGNTQVTLAQGKVSLDIFGGGKGSSTTVTGDATVNVGAKSADATPVYTGTGMVRNVYGGSALGAVNATKGAGDVLSATTGKTTTVNIYAGTVDNVFGGGLGHDDEDDAKDIAAQNFGSTTVLVENSDNNKVKVSEAVYGGANVNGVLKADAKVTLLGGTIGNSEDASGNVVFGGGKGEPTLVNGDVTVNIGTKSTDATPVYSGNASIYGNVYGGSALGNTNKTSSTDNEEYYADKNTNVNLYAGTINGNVFGGGLGRKAAAAIGTEGQEGYVAPVTAVESFVGGNVNVLLDGVKFVQSFTGEGENRMPLTAQIFGANNLNGTPKGHVKVQVERTVNTDPDKNALKNNPETALEARTTYDVAAVYGGGNQADYIPVDPTPETQLNDTEDYAEIIIRGCGATSIEYVYGGGNAAAVPATQVTVESAYIIHQLFGGGNGKSTDTFTNPGADVGIYNNNDTPTNYGSGKTEIKLVGGQVHEVYGGSNTKGNVRGGTSLKRSDSNTCTLKIGAIYGAGQEAPMDGDVNIVLECMPEEYVSQVFGGAKNATVNGNVSLTVTSGKYGQVFGGNNIGGSINGSITVNVYEDGCLPLIIGELYGGGYNAPYSIYGCEQDEQDGDKWTAKTSGDLMFDQEEAGRAAIEVNVYSCTSVGKVFGGGFGSTATVLGNSHVWINTMQGIVNGTKQTYSTNPDVFIGKIGQVYGGGNAAPIKGDVTIDIGTASVNKEHSTGDDAEKIGVRIIDGTDYLAATSNTTTSITAGIYGGGFSADVDGNVTLNIGTVNQNQGINIGGDIFGGGFGQSTHVTGNVTVNIGTNESGTPVGYANITGDVYGGSAKGTVNSKDNVNATTDSYTKVNFYGGTITGNLYGGGEGQRAAEAHADIYYTQEECDAYNTEHNLNSGDEGYLTTSSVKTPAQAAVSEMSADVFGPVTVTVESGVVNNVFGCNNFYGTPKDTVAVIINGGTVNHNVYGGGDEAEYTPTNSEINYPAVYVNNGTITENVFGGGLGTTATVTGNPHVTIAGGDVKKSVYGGGSLATVDGSTYIVVNSGTIGTPKDGEKVYGGSVYGNIYGGGLGDDDNIRIGLVKGNTNVRVNGGNILHNIYGGGAYGSVGTYTYASEVANAAITALATENTGKATIIIKGGTIGTDGHENGMIFGASRGDIAAPGATQDNMAWVYDTEVVIGTAGEGENTSTPSIRGSVYGSGENGHTYRNASVTIHSGMVGITDTSIDGGAAYPYRGNLYGGGCGTDMYWTDANGNGIKDSGEEHYNATAGIVGGNATVTIDGGHVVRNVYGAGAMGSVTGSTTVNISGKSVVGAENSGGGYVYAAARGNEGMGAGFATVGSTALNISGGIIWGSAFGGGQLGTVKGSVAVTVSGGVVKNDVYGGGALANTNTDNWAPGSKDIYVEVLGLSKEKYIEKTDIVAGSSSVSGLYTRTGGSGTEQDPYTYTQATGIAVSGTKYYEYVPASSLEGLYERSGTEGNYTYSLTGETSYNGTGTYYEKRQIPGDWATGMNVPNSEPVAGRGPDPTKGTKHKTLVTLTGGVVGNVYGGGLGRLAKEADGGNPAVTAIAANVYGDVRVSINRPDSISKYGGSGVAFTKNPVDVTTTSSKSYSSVPTMGRVFGCNNLNGCPLGDVLVEVYGTRQIDENGNIVSGHKNYEIQAVYGGGDQADYLPNENKKTQVVIDGCGETSISRVYGGGNSAAVPATDVVIWGSYDIEYAFGGGNGSQPINKNGSWVDNTGANVNGSSSITCHGGKIGQVFGGSDALGVCRSTNPTLEQAGSCPLVITKLYGAGSEADVDGDVNVVIAACTETNSQIEYVCGGSYKAHITGDVTLTITSGYFKNVYGGNDQRGGIGGNITVNIEETDPCDKPIIIENLVGGGNNAKYPGTDKDGHEFEEKDRTITVNVKSATRIDNVYGGSFIEEATANTQVNINMVRGGKSGREGVLLPSDYENYSTATGGKYHNISNIRTSYVDITDGLTPGTSSVVGYYTDPSGTTPASGVAVEGVHYYEKQVTGDIDAAIGTIGNVYGGGQHGKVNGNSVVNIGSSTTVGIMRRGEGGVIVAERDASGNITSITYDDQTVLGAHITGDVFGGGEEAFVTGNATVNYCTVDYSGTTGFEDFSIGGSIYGGGSEADVLGNTNVTMAGGYVYDGVYGGGLMGSVGTAANTEGSVVYHTGSEEHTGCIGKIVNYKANTGISTVTISGGQIGPVEVATKGMINEGGDGPVDVGFVFGAGRGEVVDPEADKDADFHTFVKETYVTISGGLIMASVYGGGENGRVAGDTHVTISGGQIGCSEAPNDVPKVYTESEWTAEDPADFKECKSWEYGKIYAGDTKKKYLPYDPYASDTDPEARKVASDGHTYYGNVFGGGSGYHPYEIKNLIGTVVGHEWLRSAGQVYGNTVINITGGHILTSVYGGNETTDVGTYTRVNGQVVAAEGTGKCTISMTGGTVGVPRTDDVAQNHPVTCCLFGAGKGDQRTHFNTWTNVQETEVNVSGTARIFGSVLGGGEDGHVLGNAVVNIGDVTINETAHDGSSVKIGTKGTSNVDGNVFGGGRGFSGVALTAGSVGGNATVNISDGTMLGSVYGGGRLASVGIPFTSPSDDSYGQLLDDVPAESKTYGHITINISGGTIGTTTVDDDTHYVGGNVFGGSMGRITLLDGSLNKLWPRQAVVKLTQVNISGGTIYNNVYGGSEYGIVRNYATINMTGGSVLGNVFGGGYGSDRQEKITITPAGYSGVYYSFTPMLWTGCVSGSTFVTISNGTVGKNVYGGGEMASVGLIDFVSDEHGNFTNMPKQDNPSDGFALSWPYKFTYHAAAPGDPEAIGGGKVNGKATVSISGSAVIGTKEASVYKDNTGYVFGGSKGKVWFGADKDDEQDITEQRYTEAFCGNVRESEITINGGTMRTIYGGGDDGHIEENATITINDGTIERSVFGAGRGTSTYKAKLMDPSTKELKATAEDVHSWTAGKVYGNTTVNVNGGNVGWYIYGGGNMASVGKGNYSGGADDYSTTGYGETLTGDLWTIAAEGDNAWQFLNSGKTTINLLGGTVGAATAGFADNGVPYGSVFGGSRGTASIETDDVYTLSPLYRYIPDFYLGYANNTVVNIGGTTEDGPVEGAGPTIYGSIYGGAQDGHVRNSTVVKMFKGSVAGQTSDTAGRTGHIFGAGSGIGTYTENAKNMISSSSGSVTCTTHVEINNGSITGNVYGGGAMASVGPPKIAQEKNEQHSVTGESTHKSFSFTQVDIKGGTIGGSVYGASRGPGDAYFETQFTNQSLTYDKSKYATNIWSDVNITGGTINNNVYGGGQGGVVKESTMVSLTGGSIAHDAYGGGQGTVNVAADILGNTTLELNKGVLSTAKGCSVDKVFGCNDQNGTPKGHVLVHVYGTQNSSTANMETNIAPPSFTATKGAEEGYMEWLGRLITEATVDGGLAAEASQITEAQTLLTSLSSTAEESLTNDNKNDITNKANAIINALKALYNYDVTAVYGGGDLAPYEPTVSEDNTEVIIEGCDVTSIKQVYGGGNAAYTPATNVLVKSAYVIDELFGGGNGLDNYVKDGKWYENPGANVGYKQLEDHVTDGTKGTGVDEENKYQTVVKTSPDATTKEGRMSNYSIGTGVAATTVNGGHIYSVYGGSNKKGNIRAEALLTVQQAGSCPLIIDKTYSGSKEATIDAETNTILDCVRQSGAIYGGSQNADILNDVHVRITNGHYTQVFGGNEKAGTITGSITIDIEENGCTPIVIDELYAGGYLAPYSVYGYAAVGEPAVDKNGNPIYGDDGITQLTQRRPLKKGDAGALATPSRDPQINVISATKIGKIYGGGYEADLIGSPHININMTTGRIREAYASEYPNATYPYITLQDDDGNKIIPIGTIGTIFGGGNKGDIYGDTHVEIGTGTHHNAAGVEETITPARNAAFILREEAESGRVYGGGNLGDVKGNTNIMMGNGYVYDRIYGGGKEGNVGTISTSSKHTGDDAHDGDCIGKPTVFAANTGRTAVTISGGYVGPFTYSAGVATITPMAMPQDYGYVFGAGRGELTNPATDPDIDFRTYVDSTRVVIKNGYVAGHEGDAAYITRPLIAGGVYGGAENGRVLHNTGVFIQGGQIGLGKNLTAAYAEADWIDPTTATASEIIEKAATMPECAAWEYGKIYEGKNKKEWLPYDEHAGTGYDTENYGPASTTGSDGHTFYGNVFGGGSGYFTYETATAGVYEWLMSAGMVEGDTYVDISGGHILTNVYGGNEMTNINGTAHVTMTGGTLGVPRTVAQIMDHPVTCNLFGGGKGDTRVHFNKSTNVGDANVKVSGGIIYGSVFGGGEDGHVMRNAKVTISDDAKIGTWGTSYADGNVFGGGRGFSAEAYTAGNVAGTVTVNITGGTMLGSVYGGGRLASVGYGLYMKTEEGKYGTIRPDNYADDGTTAIADFKRGYVEMNITGGTIGNKYEFVIPNATNIAAAGIVGVTKAEDMTAANWTTWKNYHNVPNTSYDTSNGRVTHTKGGNVFAGGMGRRVQLDGVTEISAVDWRKLGNVKSTDLTISGTPWIMGNVYGGCELGMVRTSEATEANAGTTTVTITGGTIGTEVTGDVPTKTAIPLPATYPNSGNSNVKYTYGTVYGGGMGAEKHETVADHGGNVDGNTTVSISGNDTEIRASVFGGSELATVGGNTYVTISGGKIGRKEVKALDDANAGYVMFGGATMGNVYGGGKGELDHTLAGLVKGNTNITISGGEIYHMVYGGGALGSVGTFELSEKTETGYNPAYIPFAGIPYEWTEGTGTATVTIIGGTIGISGRDNGLVFGSSRGNLQSPVPDATSGDKLIDPYDKVAWVSKTVVTIGTAESGDLASPHIKCSVYGGGENGHNNESATVNVYSGTIGITSTEDPWYNFGTNETVRASAQRYRGNVYGAGSGADYYTVDGIKYYNAKSGMVAGNTFVNIYGGHVGRSVYGGGAMASVGTIINENDTIAGRPDKHSDETNGFALSWPYEFKFAEGTGKATVNIYGGHFGTYQLDGGDVYGSSRGTAGDRYAMAHLAYTKETEVNVNYSTTIDFPDEASIENDFTKQCITGSVHGSGEDGYVHGDTHVTLTNGLIGHSLYGAGKGTGTYDMTLTKIGGGGTYNAHIYSLIAGRVMGNTYVTMNGGRVGRNVYGGGNMGSVGKGNYASGTDDYAHDCAYGAAYGYGEKIDETLWTPTSGFDPDAPITSSNSPTTLADHFLSSGKTTVKVLGGTVGYINAANPEWSMKSNLPYGNVFGGSTGESAPNIVENPRYDYSPAFFSGYVNETDVTIGKTRSDFATDEAYNTYLTTGAPKIFASVYGGGQDGHVRRDTKVTVNSGEIGLTYNGTNQALVKQTDTEHPQWLYRGNVYGAGSGISEYRYDFTYDGDYVDTVDYVLAPGTTVPTKETDYSNSAGSVTRFTDVHINGGTIHRNIYGGGSMGSVGAPNMGQTYVPYKKGDTADGHGPGRQSMCTVTIAGTIGTVADYRANYGGNVFGASRGLSILDATQFATSVWTKVLIKNGATIMGNVFGGGDAGTVFHDTDVQIGGE